MESKNVTWCLDENEIFALPKNNQEVYNIMADGSESPTIDVEVEDSSDFNVLSGTHSFDEVDIDSESQMNMSDIDTDNSPRKNKRRRTESTTSHSGNIEDQDVVGRGADSSGGSLTENGLLDEDDEMIKIKTKFKQGCDCPESNCFENLDPRNVYRHRLNITELTKAEHDMYLMGLTKACMSTCSQTSRNKERQRLRAHYFYQGSKVCLTAFLFLENCTRYQLKSIRKHVINQGITPRVHGNHGKRPHNMFSLETYNQASEFLKKYFEEHNVGSGYSRVPFTISSDMITRKHIHDLYLKSQNKMGDNNSTDRQIMGYTTFLYFLKHQFPHIKFCKVDVNTKNIKDTTKDKISIRQTNNSIISVVNLDIPDHHESKIMKNKKENNEPTQSIFNYVSLTGTKIDESGQDLEYQIVYTEEAFKEMFSENILQTNEIKIESSQIEEVVQEDTPTTQYVNHQQRSKSTVSSSLPAVINLNRQITSNSIRTNQKHQSSIQANTNQSNSLQVQQNISHSSLTHKGTDHSEEEQHQPPTTCVTAPSSFELSSDRKIFFVRM